MGRMEAAMDAEGIAGSGQLGRAIVPGFPFRGDREGYPWGGCGSPELGRVTGAWKERLKQ
jgi:hypothetical protein